MRDANELGPDGKEWAKTEAGYAHVESMMPRADGPGPYWYGWALREAFVAGAAWQERRTPEPLPSQHVTEEQVEAAFDAFLGKCSIPYVPGVDPRTAIRAALEAALLPASPAVRDAALEEAAAFLSDIAAVNKNASENGSNIALTRQRIFSEAAENVRALKAAPAPDAAEGMVLVPREPTKAMIRAGVAERDRAGSGGSVSGSYRAMIAAAPSHKEQK